MYVTHEPSNNNNGGSYILYYNEHSLLAKSHAAPRVRIPNTA